MIGAGEFARQVVRLVEDANRDGDVYELLGFLDNRAGSSDPELRVIGTDELLSSLDADYVIGVGAPGLRRKLGTFAQECGRHAASLVHSASFVDRRADLGDGALIAECAHVQYGATVGRHAIVNVNSVVGHDSTIGDHVAIAGNVMVGARTTVGDDVLFGMGSVVLADVKVGDRAVIGAGAVVTRDVPADTCVVGVPARVLAPAR